MADRSAAPLPRSYWVEPGRFLAGSYPSERDPVAADRTLDVLLDAGIRCWIDLTQPGELEPYEDRLLTLAAARDIEVSYTRSAIRDVLIPTREEMLDIQERIDRSIAANAPVFVHCFAGRGRTGTVVGVYLIRQGRATPESFLDVLSELRGRDASRGPSPDSSEQIGFVRSWRPSR